MKNFKRNIKAAAVVLFTVFIRFLAAQVSGPDPVSYSYSPSRLVDALGVGSVAGPLMIITYSFLAFLFIKFEKRIQGSRLMKGFKFSSIGFIYFWGFVELIPIKNPPILQTIKYGFLEGGICAIFFMIMSLSFGSEVSKAVKYKNEQMHKIIIITIVFCLGRYFSYFIGMESEYTSKVLQTFLWTLVMGLWIGFTYILFPVQENKSALLKNAVTFGIVIYGIPWLIFSVFAPALFTIEFAPILLRAVLDVLYVVIGVYMAEKPGIFQRNKVQLPDSL